jgi:hypothetical protein
VHCDLVNINVVNFCEKIALQSEFSDINEFSIEKKNYNKKKTVSNVHEYMKFNLYHIV